MAAFRAPASKLVFERSRFSNAKSTHTSVIEEHTNNYAVNIIVPDQEDVPTEVDTLLRRHEYYLVHDLSLSVLIQREFIGAFLSKGTLCMLSYGKHVDTDNVASILPSGHLILNIKRDLYEELGLEGKPSEFNFRDKNKFVVTIDLTAASFKPSSKSYERVRWCLQDRCDLRFDFLYRWEPPDEKICPSSLAAYFKSHGYKVDRCSPSRTVNRLKALRVPHVSGEMLDETDDSCDHKKFFEWLGACACDIQREGKPDDYLSTFVCPEPNSIMNCVSATYTGYFSPAVIQQGLHSIREEMKRTKRPWASVTVHGFQDSPVSWKLKEHGHHKCGDNLYTYVVFPDESYWLYMAVGPNDECP